MTLCWAAATYLETEKHFRRILGYKARWILEAALREGEKVTKEENQTQEGAVLELGELESRQLQTAAA